MKNQSWEELRRDLRTVVAREGVDKVALRLPAHRSTVYRLVRGGSRQPIKAIFRAVEKIVADATLPADKVPGP